MDQIESRLNDMSIINKDETKWGWPLTDLYKESFFFYKGTYIFMLSKIGKETIICDLTLKF